jgi:hypothetical protein
MEADKIEVEEGDLVCFRTGYDRVILGMNSQPDAAVLAANPGAGLDGRDDRLLDWVTRSGAVALISDNRAVEQVPARPFAGEGPYASLPCCMRIVYSSSASISVRSGISRNSPIGCANMAARASC